MMLTIMKATELHVQALGQELFLVWVFHFIFMHLKKKNVLTAAPAAHESS